MSDIDSALLSAIDALQLRYVAALDGKDMSRWLDTFAEEDNASYICISDENLSHGLELGLMYDDNRARLQDRVTYITEIWAGTFQDYRTRHFVQRVNAERIDDWSLRMRSNFSVFYTPENTGVSEVLATGVYEDVISTGNGAPRLLSRKAILDTTVLPRYLVYPV